MAKLHVNQSQKRAIGIATIAAIVGGAVLLKPYFTLIVLSIILAFLFSPIYKWLLARWHKPGRSAMTTLIIAALLIVIPTTCIIVLCIHQIEHMLRNVNTEQVTTFVNNIVDTINRLLQNSPVQIDESTLSTSLENALKSAGESLLSKLSGAFGGFLSALTSFIIFIYVFISLLTNGDKLLGFFHTINPLGQEISQLYAQKMSAMTKATVRGQFIIAFLQGLVSAIGLYIVGFHDLFFFFLILLTALSFIPMGAGIVTIPIGIILILLGDVWQGVFIILNHLLIVTNIDNVLRPILVPRSARLNPALMILAVFSGIAYFGFMGIVIGPVIMIVIITTLQVFMEVYRDIEMENVKDGPNKGIGGLYKKATSRAKEIIGVTKEEA